MNGPPQPVPIAAEGPPLSLIGAIEKTMGSVCLRNVDGRAFAGRLIRQHDPEVNRLEASDDVLLVYHSRGASPVERWYDNKLSSVGSKPGQVTVLPPGRASGWRLPDPVEVLHLYVPSLMLRRFAERDLGLDAARIEIVDSFASDDPVGAALARAALSSPEGDGLDGLFLDAIGQAVAIHLLRRHAIPPVAAARWGEQPNALSPERLRRVCDYVEAHLAAELSLDELAGAACLSTYHLSRCFRRTTGTTLHSYVMARRTERARSLLCDPRLTLADIAYRCGFASQSHFTAVFKKSVGLTPGHYRRTALV